MRSSENTYRPRRTQGDQPGVRVRPGGGRRQGVFLRMNGMQVYDLNTGANVYSAAFDYTPDKVVDMTGGAKKLGIYGAVADPVFVGDDMYVLDMSNKKNQYVKKYGDRMSGKLLWTSPETSAARAIPGMYVVGDQVLPRIGGAVEAQAYIYKRESDGQAVTITEEWRIFGTWR
ncbi:MAG: hypothetical protein R2810_09235 [Flavobacteriales bacterium]